jgi:hypothetical protein
LNKAFQSFHIHLITTIIGFSVELTKMMFSNYKLKVPNVRDQIPAVTRADGKIAFKMRETKCVAPESPRKALRARRVSLSPPVHVVPPAPGAILISSVSLILAGAIHNECALASALVTWRFFVRQNSGICERVLTHFGAR